MFQVLVDNMDLLSKNLEPRRHYGYLRSATVLNVEDQETIDNPHLTRSQRTIRLIDIIRTKGPRAFDALCESLEQDKTQVFLLSELHKSLEREIGNCYTPCLKKTVQNCFCQNLIIFGKKMAKRLKLCEMHSFSTSPNSRVKRRCSKLLHNAESRYLQ